jgi:hypothetical protein
MKQLIIITFLLFCFEISYAQLYDTTRHNVSAGIIVPQHSCAGEEIYIYYDRFWTGISIGTTDAYFKWNNPNECNPNNVAFDYYNNNNSLKWEVDGTFRKDPNNPFAIYAKLNSSGTIKLSCQYSSFIPSNNCQNSRTYTTLFTGTSRRTIVVPIPKSFTISPDKVTLRFPESTFIRGSGCPNTLLAENIPQSSSKIHWSFGCDINGNPTIPSIFITNNNDAIGAGNGSTFGAYGINRVFAKCNDNGCISTEYAKTKYTLQSTITGDNTILGIDVINKASNRSDYHQYETSIDMCIIGGGNTNCTKQKVFDLLLSSKANQGPVADDFVGLVGSDSNGKISLFGSKLIFSSDDSPILNGDVVNLPGPTSFLPMVIAMNHISTSRIGRTIRKKFLGNNNSGPLISNPIKMLVDNASFSVTNYTLPGHFLYPGKVIRTVVEDCGKISIVTIGVGYSWVHDFPITDDVGNPIPVDAIFGLVNKK